MAILPYKGNPFPYDPMEVDDSAIPEIQESKTLKRIQRFNTFQNALQGGLGAAGILTAYNSGFREADNRENRIREINDQAPIFDLNYMYGPGTNQGAEYQPVIKAENGALVRKTVDGSAPFRLDHGEMIILPDGKLEKIKGDPKITDNVATILPEGSKVFSNTLTPENSDKTYAEIASRYDYSDYLDVLANPYSSAPAKRSAELMSARLRKKLDVLFDDQQSRNGDSSGEMSNEDGGIYIKPKNRGKFTEYAKEHGKGVQEMASHILANKEDYSSTIVKRANFAKNASKWNHEDGGYIHYQEGGEYEMSDEQIERLKKLGYKIEIL